MKTNTKIPMAKLFFLTTSTSVRETSKPSQTRMRLPSKPLWRCPRVTIETQNLNEYLGSITWQRHKNSSKTSATEQFAQSCTKRGNKLLLCTEHFSLNCLSSGFSGRNKSFHFLGVVNAAPRLHKSFPRAKEELCPRCLNDPLERSLKTLIQIRI